MCTWLSQGGQRRERQREGGCKTSLIYMFLSNLMQALSHSVYYNFFPLVNTDFSCSNSKIDWFIFTSALIGNLQPLMANLTSSGRHCVLRELGGGSLKVLIYSLCYKEGRSPQGWLWAQCAVSQNIMTCQKLLYKEGSLHVLFNMLSYSQSVIYTPLFRSFLCLQVCLIS